MLSGDVEEMLSGYSGHRDFTKHMKDLTRCLLAMPRNALTQHSLSERTWLVLLMPAARHCQTLKTFCSVKQQINCTEIKIMSIVSLLNITVKLQDIITVLQHGKLTWCSHVLRKNENDWAKKRRVLVIVIVRGWPRKMWKEVVNKVVRSLHLNKEDAVVYS